MGSVKDLVVAGFGSNYYNVATPQTWGFGVWDVSGRWSVADLKSLLPSYEVKGQAEALAMSTAAYFEAAAGAGINSCYVGMLDRRGCVVSVDQLLDRGETSHHVAMMLANVPRGKGHEPRRAYHDAINRGEISIYVADAEAIFRRGLPLGSSTFGKICRAGDVGEEYERAATYDQTVAVLKKVKSEGRVLELLATLGLTSVPHPGIILPEPVFNYTTKFHPAGDLDMNDDEVLAAFGNNAQTYAKAQELLGQTARHQQEFCEERGIVNIDGKVEMVVSGQDVLLGDFACTPHENRLMLPYERDGVTYLLPTNKEIARALFRQEGVYAARDEAKLQHGDDWMNHFYKHFPREKLEPLAQHASEVMSDALLMVANKMLGREVFSHRRLEDWVDTFLPYASRMESK